MASTHDVYGVVTPPLCIRSTGTDTDTDRRLADNRCGHGDSISLMHMHRLSVVWVRESSHRKQRPSSHPSGRTTGPAEKRGLHASRLRIHVRRTTDEDEEESRVRTECSPSELSTSDGGDGGRYSHRREVQHTNLRTRTHALRSYNGYRHDQPRPPLVS